VIKINLKDLITIMPDVINLFLSGFIFVCTYNWLNKKTDTSILTVWSLFISILIKSFYATLHNYILSGLSIPNSFKILILSSTGFILALVCTYLKNTKFIKRGLYYANNKSIHDDIFDDIIDYNKRTMMRVFIKSSNVYYLGRFSFGEEKGLDSWISLIDYCCVDKNTHDTLFDPDNGGLCSSVVINLKDIERIEIIYENDSVVWKWLKDK